MTSECKSLSFPNTYYKLSKLEEIIGIYNALNTLVGDKYPMEKIEYFARIFELTPSSDKKTIERIYSRIALFDLLVCSNYFAKTKNNLESIKLNHHYQLVNFPDVQCSLSHCQNGFSCIYTTSPDLFLGIDLEPRTRIINPNSKRFFSSQNDTSEPLLNLWVKKEAAFKAIHHYVLRKDLHSPPTGLHEITVCHDKFYFEDKVGNKSKIQGDFLDFSSEDFIHFAAKISLNL